MNSISLNGKTVLIVDDEEGIREVLQDELSFFGAKTLQASGGLDAIQTVNQDPSIDVVVSDIRMPKGSGIDLLNSARLKNTSKPIFVLITGFADLSSEKAFQLGVDAMLQKPFDLSILTREMDRLLTGNFKHNGDDQNLPVIQFSEMNQKSIRLGRKGFSIRLVDSQMVTASQLGRYVKTELNLKLNQQFITIQAIICLRWVNRANETFGYEWIHLDPVDQAKLESLAKVSSLICSIPESNH